jgi:hypothetical protein
MLPVVSRVSVLCCLGACLLLTSLAGCDGTGGDTSVDIAARIAFAPGFSGTLKDHQNAHVKVHRQGGVATIIGTSSGRFSVKASHLSGPLASIPPEFTNGRYTERFTILRLAASPTVEHAHNVALLHFSDRAGGSACIVMNGPLNLSTARVRLKFVVLGGTGEGAKVRMTGSASARIGSSPVRLSGHGKLAIGKPQPIPALCRNL